MLPIPKLEIIGGCSSCKTLSAIGRKTTAFSYREFPKHEVACVLQTQVVRAMQAFSHISALADFASSFVLFLLGRPDLTEMQFNVRWEL